MRLVGRTWLTLVGVVLVACGNDSDTRDSICDDLYERTNACAADIACEGVVSRRVYVDQCRTVGYSSAQRDAFVASSCAEINASSCLATASFYRDNCACNAYAACPSGQSCEPFGDDSICLQQGLIPYGAADCDDNQPCPAGYACAVSTTGDNGGACVQLCAIDS